MGSARTALPRLAVTSLTGMVAIGVAQVGLDEAAAEVLFGNYEIGTELLEGVDGDSDPLLRACAQRAIREHGVPLRLQLRRDDDADFVGPDILMAAGTRGIDGNDDALTIERIHRHVPEVLVVPQRIVELGQPHPFFEPQPLLFRQRVEIGEVVRGQVVEVVDRIHHERDVVVGVR